ncbi:unnamed protein product [Sympodiomycopsis kandeliae]
MTDQDIRARSRDLLHSSLEAGASSISLQASSDQLSSLASSIESAIYEASGSTTSNEYRDSIRQRSLFVKKDNPQALLPALLDSNLTPLQFAQASHSELQSPQQNLSDSKLQEENISNSIGLQSNFIDGDVVQSDQVVNDTQENGASGQIGVAEEMLGGEGEFKARGQPKTGKAMEGIEFETPQ